MFSGSAIDFTDTDRLLIKVLDEAGTIREFLNRVFGFLFRCVDSDEAHAERKDNKSKHKQTNRRPPQLSDCETGGGEDQHSPLVDAGIYNGAQCDGYQWAQTHTDLDVRVAVEPEIRAARDVSVVITSTNLSVKVGSGEGRQTLVEGELRYKIRPGDSVWTLLPGQHIHILLEKATERWWESLLSNETALDVTKMHRTRSLGDLPEAERDAVIGLMEKHHAR